MSTVIGADTDLDILFEQVKLLRELAANPDLAADDGKVYDFSIRWGAMISGRLPRLAYYHDRGVLSEHQRARYGQLCSDLNSLASDMQRLKLPRPKIITGQADSWEAPRKN
ncbi:hypothetical protein FOS14_04115 [Skermania sp. ID1734]|uniref:hypothetical protein n=1 Tax=Skermania sp. ID1734 TaxID=2597516 RepID=UPI00117DEB9D|nr:hypothetical protein [Skermania sp. ID1734]TSE00961.1 hypothetical protein FOS14_04115 [Skermania sp. ID1734]